MPEKKCKPQKIKKPFNHVLEVQNGFIPISMIMGHIDKALKKELESGKISTQ